MDDLISRQAAIDLFPNDYLECDTKGGYIAPHLARQMICELPSVQPEIVRCKDCKHKYIEDNVWKCPFGLPGGENFFCGYGSLGRVERRTDEGFWNRKETVF